MDNLSPVYQGDLSPWTLNQKNRDGTPRSLTGVSAGSIVIKLQAIDGPQNIIIGGGTCTIPPTTAANGVLIYTPVANDVATPGPFWLWCIIPWTSGVPQHSDPYGLVIDAAP